MSGSKTIAQFAVYNSTSDLDAQVKFYENIGFEVDHGWEPVGDVPDEYYQARGVSKGALIGSVAMKLPADPYFHIIFSGWKDLKTVQNWPATYDQIGSRGHSFLVESVSHEVARVKREFPHLKILESSMTVARKWGKTTTALIIDPEDVFFELVEIEKGSVFDSEKKKKTPSYDERSFLHFMLNCSNYEKTSKFYRSFGYTHDHGVDFRPEVGFHPIGFAAFGKQMQEGVGLDMDTSVAVDFLSTPSDESHMHLELCDYKPGYLRDPGDIRAGSDLPVWPLKGIRRYCIKTNDYHKSLTKAKEEGQRIYIEDQRGCLNWGDSQWFYQGDVDGNIVTLEQWFPQRAWGEKS